MVVAMLINKKGIRLKKLWRTILITTIAVPQFISLLFMSRFLSTNDGALNHLLINLGIINQGIKFNNYGNYNYPIRTKNIRNIYNFSQKDILNILNDLRYTKSKLDEKILCFSARFYSRVYVVYGFYFLVGKYN